MDSGVQGPRARSCRGVLFDQKGLQDLGVESLGFRVGIHQADKTGAHINIKVSMPRKPILMIPVPTVACSTLPTGSTYTTIKELGTKRPSLLWFWGPYIP